MIEIGIQDLINMATTTNRHLVQSVVIGGLTALGIVGILAGQTTYMMPIVTAGYAGIIGYEFAAQAKTGAT